MRDIGRRSVTSDGIFRIAEQQRQRFTSTRQRLKASGWRGIELGAEAAYCARTVVAADALALPYGPGIKTVPKRC